MSQDVTEQAVHVDPFAGDSLAFKVTHPMSISLLQEEIAAQVYQGVQVALSVEKLDQEISTQHPAVVFVSPGDLDTTMVRKVIDVHEVPVVQPDPNLAIITAITAKLKAGKTLTLAEVSATLRTLLKV